MLWTRDLENNPAFVAALAQARAELDRAVEVRCGWGACVNEVDPLTGRILGGVGPAGCPCEWYPGGWSTRHEGRPQPRVLTKVRGRHGSRIQRSIRRHTPPAWMVGLRAA